MIKTVDTAYDKNAADSYDNMRFSSNSGKVFNELEEEQLLNAQRLVGVDFSALEVGCGTGRFTSAIANYAKKVVAIDPSEHMLKIAKDKCSKKSNVEFKLAEGGSLPFQDHCFDFTYAIRVTNQTGSKKYAIEMIEEMIRVTKPGGHILVEVCNADRLFQKQLVGVRLGRMDIESINNVAICSISGVLVMSLTGLNWLNFLPIKYIKFIASMDRWVGKKWPWSASRVYVFMRKNKP